MVHRRAGPRDDLVAAAAGGLGDYRAATPLQVAATSAGTFACGALLPLAAASAFHLGAMPLGIALVSLAAVAALAACGAPAGAGRPGAFALRTTTWAAAGFAGAFAAGRIVGTMLV
ncbi:hypothetical protein H7F53_12510 [Novosphingobium piscinae]|uniref:VIT family protein n=1 Tax=Novosphingobium piscinae TaxID=1507448 RepID=A0A7X1FZP2_9SPHN|nr:hypothetical protein [Novosphingobium piscinae]